MLKKVRRSFLDFDTSFHVHGQSFWIRWTTRASTPPPRESAGCLMPCSAAARVLWSVHKCGRKRESLFQNKFLNRVGKKAGKHTAPEPPTSCCWVSETTFSLLHIIFRQQAVVSNSLSILFVKWISTNWTSISHSDSSIHNLACLLNCTYQEIFARHLIQNDLRPTGDFRRLRPTGDFRT